MRLIEALPRALSGQENSVVFRVEVPEDMDWEDAASWSVSPMAGEVLEEAEGLFIVRAVQVAASGETTECFMDLSLPERVADHAYFLCASEVERKHLHECAGEVICAVPVDAFGQYDLFYSRRRPELGIAVLRRGLELAPHKAFMAEDLGYILRDEDRLEEAAQAFEVSASEGPSSTFIHHELAELYDSLGQPERAAEHRARCPDPGPPAPTRPWWRFW